MTKFCIRNPANCDPGSASCFFLSFQHEESSVFIEMSGPSEGYLAFAFSHDQWMVSVLFSTVAFVMLVKSEWKCIQKMEIMSDVTQNVALP